LSVCGVSADFVPTLRCELLPSRSAPEAQEKVSYRLKLRVWRPVDVRLSLKSGLLCAKEHFSLAIATTHAKSRTCLALRHLAYCPRPAHEVAAIQLRRTNGPPLPCRQAT